MVSRSLVLALSLLVAPAIACGGKSGTYYIPASHPVKPFEPPEREELLPEEEDVDDWSADDGSAGEAEAVPVGAEKDG